MTLEPLDTIIVFVVIITSVRLLITTLTRMVSALLGLRAAALAAIRKEEMIQALHMLA